MPDIQLALIDWITLVAYLVGIAVIGVLAGRKVKSTGEYFLGGRRFSKWLIMGQSFGTGTHAEMPVSLAGAVYSFGLSGIWYQWKNLFATPFYWLIAPIFRRVRRTTVAEMIEDRYGPWMGAIYTLFALTFFTINMASMLKGAGKVINQAVGGSVPVNEIVVAMTVVFVLYSFVGGLVATAWTDFLQGFLIIALSFALIPLGWSTVGGMSGMRASLDAYRFSLAAPEGIGVWFVLVLTINGLVGIFAQPQMVAAVGTGRDELACRIGYLGGTSIKRFCTIGWALVGLMVASMVAQGKFGAHALADPEEAFGFACRHSLFPGAIGLLIACFLAANMAACSAFMVNSGALFTQNFYRKYVARAATDRHYLWVGRLSGVGITLAAVIYALFFIKSVLYSFLLTETMATYVGIGTLGGIVWRRATRWGAAASLAVAMGVNFAMYRALGARLDHWDPMVFLTSLAAGTVALVVVSWMSRREDAARFYTNLETSSDDDSATPESTARAGRQLLLVNLLSLRRGAAGVGFWRAYRADLVGFVAGWIVVAALVGGVWLMFR